MGLRINIGCGKTPTRGWLNYDNSPAVRLARYPFSTSLLRKVGALNAAQYSYAVFCRANNIQFVDATRKLPHEDDSVENLYSSHMFHHLNKTEASHFIRESLRVLEPGGTLRIVVPDLRLFVDHYLMNGDADALMENINALPKRATGILSRAVAGSTAHRGRRWMYDGASLSRMLLKNGFSEAKYLPAGMTTIPDPGYLDLREREMESLYVEGRKA